MRAAVIYNETQNAHNINVLSACRDGLNAIGVSADLLQCNNYTSLNFEQYDAIVVWGWRKGRRLVNAGKQVLVAERGYIGSRSEWFSLGWNGLNNRADFLNDLKKYSRILPIACDPWKKDGDYILLCGQVAGDMSLQGRDLQALYPYIARRLKREYGKPVRWRPHPESIKKGHNIKVGDFEPSTNYIDDDLDGAYMVATFNSNSAVDAVMAGVPAMAIDAGCMAWDVVAHDFSPIVRPNRGAWLKKMAYTQWNVDEMASGEAFNHIWRKYV